MWICATKQVAVFLENERRVEFSGSGNDEFCGRSDSVQHRARSDASERLSRATVSTKDIVGSNTTTAETTVDRLHLDRLTA